jgi:predicted metal-binding membrane protein
MLSLTLPRTGLLWLGFYAAILVAWMMLLIMALPRDGLPDSFWASLCLPADQAGFPTVWGMWGLMVAAMMLPTFVPALRTYTDLAATGATTGDGAMALVAGYALIWVGAAALGAAVQIRLAQGGLLTAQGQSASVILSASLLFSAGLYQFSNLKGACLAKCRMPLTFFMQYWKPGAANALRMGLHLGVLCLGCCWALMALGFVGGVNNLLWMGAATVFMTLEKLPEIGRFLTRPAGVALIVAGLIRLTAI